MRDDFSIATKELLAKRVALRCSNPGCRHVTSGPQKNPVKVINTGVAAHITAASADGPRYDPSLTPKERRSPENGIWLCQSCAKLVDNDPIRYGVEILHQWKVVAETNAAYELEHSRSHGTDDTIELSINDSSGQPNINWTIYVAKVRQLNEIPCYVPQKVRLSNRLLNLEEALKLQPCLFVLGPAGAGKTANLRHAHISLLDQIPRRIPIWVQLDLYEPKIGLLGLVQQGLGQYGLQLTGSDIIRVLKSAEVELIMDGWTEVYPDHRDYLRKEFRRWRLEYPHHRYVISGRRNETYGISNDAELGFTGLSTAELQPFSDADLSQFLFKALGFDADLGKLSPRLKEAAQWPLYAKMIAQVWKEKSIVDATYVAELVEHVLTREIIKGVGTLPDSLRDEIDEFMTELGADMHRRLVTVMPRSHARDLIREKWSRFRDSGRVATTEERTIQAVFESPLIVSEGNIVRFAHQIFQEFFAARWLATKLKAETEHYRPFVSDPWWTYPVVFATAKAPDAVIVLELVAQSRNIWAISRCLAGDAGDQPRDYCRTVINSLLEKGEDNRRFAIHCLIETIDDPWAFEKLMNVISEEEQSRGGKELIPTQIRSTILNDALRPFMMLDYRLTRLPLQLFSKLEGLSPAARWAVASSLHFVAISGQYRENRELLANLLLKASRDSSQRVQSEAIDGLGALAYHEKYSGCGKVPRTVIDALNAASSSGQWPKSQTAFEYLLRIGEIEIDEEWTRQQVKNTIQTAEASLSSGNTEFSASLAVNFFDELIGPAICEAIEKLGDKKFEKLMLLALPTASPMNKEDILWHLSRVGSDTSVSALVKEVISRPNAENAWEHRLRLAAANALICIDTKKAINAVFELIQHDLWDIRLLGIMALLRSPIPRLEVKAEDYKTQIAQCWLEAKGEMLELMYRVGGGLLYTRKTGNSFDSESITIKPEIDNIISQLPGVELRSAARDMLIKGIETEFACRILGDLGTAEDLPYLHTKLNDRVIHTVVKSAMERIQKRTN